MDFSSSGLGRTLAQDERANWSPLLGALRRKGNRPGLGQSHWDSPALQRSRLLYPSLHPGTSLQTIHGGPNVLGTSSSPGAWFPSTQQSYGSLGSAPANTTIGGNPTGLGFAPSPQLGSNAAFGFSGSPTNQLGGF